MTSSPSTHLQLPTLLQRQQNQVKPFLHRIQTRMLTTSTTVPRQLRDPWPSCSATSCHDSPSLFDLEGKTEENLFDGSNNKKSALEDLDFLGQDLLQKTKPAQQAVATPISKAPYTSFTAGFYRYSIIGTFLSTCIHLFAFLPGEGKYVNFNHCKVTYNF
ncbi:hypothetical protein EB796_008415 [Bugula neritina]|uniref:Uncharacterized protein n=1 Tax=Bugula neritina TaxID=10212 RepID=A0A7J7K5P6_BUGNE|nr:hypothetical protein EB796_008415 [Bugula neritina]